MDIKQNHLTGYPKITLYEKLCEYWSSTGKLRKTSFLHSMIKKGIFRFDDCPMESDNDSLHVSNILDSMITTLNRVHGENWDFHLENRTISDIRRIEHSNLWIKIYYPEIEIFNSEGNHHNIKGLVVMLQLKPSDIIHNDICIGYFRGTRTNLQYNEWNTGYRHSHLTSNKPLDFYDTLNAGNFCTGNDTEVNNLKIILNEQGYTEEIFELFLLMINEMVAWESLEGVPHFRMVHITAGNNQTTVPKLYSKDKLENLYNLLDRRINYNNLEYYYTNGRYNVKGNQKLEEEIKNFVNQYQNDFRDDVKYFLIKQTSEGNLLGYSAPIGIDNEVIMNNFKENDELPYTVIQGRRIYFDIDSRNLEIPDIMDYDVHPNLLNYVTTKLEQQLYYKSVRRSTIERYHQSSNA